MTVTPAIAEITNFTISRQGFYQQTGPTTATNIFYDFDSFAYDQSPSDYTSVTLATPSSSYDMNNIVVTGGYWNYDSGQITKTELDATYTPGLYTLDASSASGSVLVSLSYDRGDNYPPPPTLTPASYDGLSGLDPTDGYTFSFGAFSPPAGYLGIITFLFGPLGSFSYSTSTEDLSTTDFYVPSRYFTLNTVYNVFLEFSTLDEVPNPPCESGDPFLCPSLGEIGWVSETTTSFTTGVPEPSTSAMMLVGFAGLGLVGYRRALGLA